MSRKLVVIHFMRETQISQVSRLFDETSGGINKGLKMDGYEWK